MKIWYQSASSYGYEPVFDEYGKTLLKQCSRVIRPDTEIHLEGIEVMTRDVENYKSLQYFQNAQIMNNMLRAEKEGYDAFAIGCTLDVGLEEGKSLLNIPVVGITEASFHVAMMLGNLFAVVTSSMAFFNVFQGLAERYGVSSKYLPGPYICSASEEEIAIALKDPKPLMEKLNKVAEKAVADGASVIIPSPTFLSSLAYNADVSMIDGAVVLDSVAVLVKTAEMMADLKKIGIEASRQIGVYARPDEAFRKKAFEEYRKVFSIKA
ncbi:MAG: aspartate/glutamate racemase family protein [Desulfobacterales bacterium]|nr:aspartate/glutamate racemase family protein [Desulfobacterales bacterium]